MKLSLNWIKDYVDIDEHIIKDLPLKLTMATAEVEGVEQKGTNLDAVVMGKITAVSPHPDSAKLQVITVDTGEAQVQSVCGAPNIYLGMKIPFAKVGGKLPGLDRVDSVVVRGVQSDGIACSLRDLGISDSHEGVLEITAEANPGDDIKELLGLEDIILDIDNKSLTHRPDLWSHYGFAREIAALTGQELKPLKLALMEELQSAGSVVTAKIHDHDKCLRYTAIGIEGIRIIPSPEKIQTRLSYTGMRPINCIVDLTNYIMLEIGQPLHTFDGDRLGQKIEIMTMAQFLSDTGNSNNEKDFLTLDGVSRQIPSDTLLICSDGQKLGLAGIMGGADSEITKDTSKIILESATFEPASVRKSATALGLRTEAVMRFEKSLDTNLALIAARRFLYLLKTIIPEVKIYSGLDDVHPHPTVPRSITISRSYIQDYMGQEITVQEIETIMTSLGFGLNRQPGADPLEQVWQVTIPTYRATKDITGRVDLVEEISRIHGYDHIVPKPFKAAVVTTGINKKVTTEHRIKDILARQFAMHEVHTYAWYDKDWIRAIHHCDPGNLTIINPNISKFDTLRRHLIPNLLASAVENEGYYDEFALFEAASVYHPAGKTPACGINGPAADALRREERHLGVVIHWKGLTPQQEDKAINRLKQAANEITLSIVGARVEFMNMEESGLAYAHPNKRCLVCIGGRRAGYISIINPAVLKEFEQNANMALMEINLSGLLETPEQKINYQEPSKYPEVNLDFNILMPRSMLYRNFNEELNSFSHPYLKSIAYKESYTGMGIAETEKSITVSVTIVSDKHTLSGGEINEFKERFTSWIATNGYSLR
jgi:phenylalanyl-tRNA synthetase beta chain